jgi:hypothetical protein
MLPLQSCKAMLPLQSNAAAAKLHTHISFTHFVRRQVFCVGVGRGLTGTMGFAGGVISPQRFRRIWLPRPKQCNGDSAPRTTPGISSVPPAQSAFVGSSSSPTYPDASHVASASS